MVNIDKSQGSVAPCFRRGGSFDYYFIANLLLGFLSLKSVNMWQSYG